MGHSVGDAAEEAGGALHALVADDDEVGLDGLGDGAQGVGGLADRRVDLDGEALGRGGRRPAASRSALVESTTSPWSGMITISGPIPTAGIGHAETRCSVAPSFPARSAAIVTAADDRWLRSVPTTIRSTIHPRSSAGACFVAPARPAVPWRDT